MSNAAFRRSALASALSIALLAPLGALAQSADAPPDAPAVARKEDEKNSTEKLDTVVVTGSRIKRSEIEGPAPVFVLSGEQLKREGFNTVYDALSTLTEAMGTVESDIAWGQHTVNASPLNLRNMGPGRSLLLINGRRVADYPLPYQGKSNFANYNNIPTAIVDRIEVLASGASAIYGSDAVAGVINVILKRNVSDNEVKVRLGTSTRGGRDMQDISFAGGASADNWSVVYALQYFNRDAMSAGERDFMDSDFDSPLPSRSPQDIGAGILPTVGIRLLRNGVRITPAPGVCEQYGDSFFLQNRRIFNRNTGTIADTGWQCGQVATYRHWTLRNGSEDRSGYFYGNYEFENGVQAWATVGVWDSTGESMTFMPAWGNTWRDQNGDTLSAVKYFTPAEIGGVDAGARTHSDELAWDVSAGLRGALFDDRFDWEFSIGRAEYRVDENFPSLLNAESDAYFFGPQVGTAPDGTPLYQTDPNRIWNPISPSQYKSISTIGRNRAESWTESASFTLNGDLFEGWAGPIGFAGTVEAAKQGYRLSPDPQTLGDNPRYFQTANIDQGSGERNRRALGLEFKVPLTESLVATAAGRYDKYDAVADDAATTYNLGLEWRPITSLLLRGTYATSFRAPDMHFVYADSSEAVADQTDYLACILAGQMGNCTWENGFKAEDVRVARRGSPGLKYENGNSWTYGFVWDITDGLSLSADYWSIHLKDEIDDIGVAEVLADEAFCLTGRTPTGEPRLNPPGADLCRLQLSRITRGPDPDGSGPLLGPIIRVESGPINRAERNVSGVDASLKYRFDTTSYGDFSIGLNYTNLMSLRTRQFPNDPLPETRTFEPRSKLRGSINWQRENWNATFYADRIGSVPSVRYGGCLPFADGYVPSADQDCRDNDSASPTFGQQTSRYYGRVGPAIILSTHVGYRIGDNQKVSLYVSNLLDEVNEEKDPYKRDFAFTADRIFSPVGREISLEYSLKF
ncbi:TonB-dependent receptor plug domain-containing protein [Tahibacter amnicola]|uniref:TonB-dependent receptor n=1 Tax=Tahibacter amnicola TaxID=2976241 RepID=A0ABY6BK91_9GAMM|nr:TonB-dependent receptor [Tahibacter amnicola]UXI70429.1 TonB-dependent receptor [Tahibacter amnicola]